MAQLSKDELNYRNMVLGKINALFENNQEVLSLEIEQDIEFAPPGLQDWLYRIFTKRMRELNQAVATASALAAGYKPVMSAKLAQKLFTNKTVSA